MKLSVVIPVYNEKETLQEILQQVESVPVDKEIILVDDGSTDGTKEIYPQLNGSTKVFLQDKNQGKGAAIQRGIHEASGEYLIIQDADLEYNPQDYLKLLQPMEAGQADVIYGSRFRGNYKNMSFLHMTGNKFLSLITSLLYGTSLTDMETCYKLFKRETIQSIPLHCKRFDFEPEITSKLLKRKLRILEVPISYDGREFHEGKKITWRDGFAALWTLIKYRFKD